MRFFSPELRNGLVCPNAAEIHAREIHIQKSRCEVQEMFGRSWSEQFRGKTLRKQSSNQFSRGLLHHIASLLQEGDKRILLTR